MQASRQDQEPLLQGPQGHSEDDVSTTTSTCTSKLQAYKSGAMHGVMALAVQATGLAFVALVWAIVLSSMPLTPLPLFGYHPMVQSLALLLLLQSILTLQPTTSALQSQKRCAFNFHRLVNLALVLPLFTVGAFIMWYLHNQPGASHFISWHGTIGFTIVIIAWLQVAIGVAITSFQGRLVGGPQKAKSLYKWHRLSGYILLPLFLFTALLGATETSWSQQNASLGSQIAIGLCLSVAAVATGLRIQTSKLPS